MPPRRCGGLPRDVALRAARGDDCAAIAAIYAHHVRTGSASFELEAPDAEEIARRYDDVLSAALAVPRLPSAAAKWSATRMPRRIVRAPPTASPSRTRSTCGPTACGMGIGRALLEELIVQSAARGARQMMAAIGDSANVPLDTAARGSGIRRARATLRTVGWKFERWLDVVLMQRALGPGAGAGPEPTTG